MHSRRPSLKLRIAAVCFALGALIMIVWLVDRGRPRTAAPVPPTIAAVAALPSDAPLPTERATATDEPTIAPTVAQLVLTAAPRPTAEATATATAERIATAEPTIEPATVELAPTETPAPTIAAPKSTPTINPAADSYPCRAGQIKGNRDTNIYHVPGQATYARTRNNVACFDTEADALSAGYHKAQR